MYKTSIFKRTKLVKHRFGMAYSVSWWVWRKKLFLNINFFGSNVAFNYISPRNILWGLKREKIMIAFHHCRVIGTYKTTKNRLQFWPHRNSNSERLSPRHREKAWPDRFYGNAWPACKHSAPLKYWF